MPTPTRAAGLVNSVVLPRDEGRHDTPIEWWYFNGHLSDDAGNQYSFHYVTFEIVTPDGEMPRLLQLSWADHAEGSYLTDERFFVADSPAGTSQAEGRFDFDVAGWEMQGDGRSYRLVFSTAGHALELQADSLKPAVLHRGTGLVDMGTAGETHYYSRTRLKVSGTLSINGATRGVTGTAWMDHQWGDSGTAVDVGWDWVSLHLDDGSELMVSLVWDKTDRRPIISYGTFVPANVEGRRPAAAAIDISGEEISLTPIGSWTSPTTGAVYPMGWELEIGTIPLALTLTPVQENAEFTNSSYIPVTYWEGAVSVAGDKNGEKLTGKGFVELVGYTRSSEALAPAP